MSMVCTSPEALRTLDMHVTNALGDVGAGLILNQLHYWMEKPGVGVMIENVKYIYNKFEDWVGQQFIFLTVWKFRQAMKILRELGLVEVIRYKSKQWNQTNYYTLNYARFREWAEAENIEISEMWSTSPQGKESQPLEMGNTSTSYKESKNTNQKNTTKQESDRQPNESEIIAAITSKEALGGEKSQTGSNPHSASSTASNGQKKVKSEQKPLNSGEEKGLAKVDYVINKDWKSLIPLLESAGVLVNKTITTLLKLHSTEKVEQAIKILKERRQDKHIPNLSGYFVAALQGDWSSQSSVAEESGDNAADKGTVFRYWYDLAKSLGYCSGQEVREGEQWVNLSGSWEKWESAIERGYSLEYLKKILKRNKN